LLKQDELTAFNQAVLPHLDAAYNLARWLARNDQDAQDVVQEASLRAFNIGKDSPDATVAHGCLRLFETLFIRGCGSDPSNRN